MAGTLTIISEGNGTNAASTTIAVSPGNLEEIDGIRGVNTTSFADAQMAPNDLNIFVDEALDTLNFKYKDSAGTVQSGSINLT